MLKRIEGHWSRQERFHHYMDNVRCTYSLTVEIDITKLKTRIQSKGLKVYPVQIYMLAAVVNRFPEFRMDITDTGDPGYWEELHPSYTVFNQDAKSFSSIWTPYQSDFASFYQSCMGDVKQYSSAKAFFPKKDTPSNVFDISSIPWVDITAFNLNVYAERTHLLPIFTIGRYVLRDGKTFMPLAMQLHHAACDGYHAGQFVEAIRELGDQCQSWLM